MTLKRRIPLIIIAVDIITAAILAFFSYQSEVRLINNVKTEQFRTVVNAIQFVFDTRSSGAAARANMVANLPIVRDGIKGGDSSALFTALKPTYDV